LGLDLILSKGVVREARLWHDSVERGWVMTERQKTVLVEVPEELAEAVKRYVARVEAATPETRGGRAVDYAAFERAVERSVGELEMDTHRRLLQSLDVDAERVLIHGRRHTRVGRYEAEYKTKAGPVTVTRSLYRDDAQRNSETVDAVSLRAGVVEDGWLPDASKAMAYLLQQGTSREAEMTGRQVGRLPYSRSSFERVGHAVGAIYEVQHAPIEDALIAEYSVPGEARSITTGLDRVSIPMEEPLSRPVGRPRKDAPKRPVERNFRMAYVGNVTLHDAEGNALHTIRYGRMPKGDAAGLCEGIGADVATLLRKRPDLKVELLMDGAPELHSLLGAEVNAAKLGTRVYDLVDFYHVIEKLSPAAAVIFGAEGVRTVHRWKMKLLNEQGAVWRILTELHESGMENETVGESRPVHDAITYLTNNGERMNHAEARELGLPIGSGSTEATCKTLFEIRFKRSGSRWKEETGSHIVHLRALALSDRWEAGVDRALETLRAPVRLAA
jgi:hypothetical protein